MMYTIRHNLALVFLLTISLKSPAEESTVLVSLNFREAPLYQVIEFYEQFKGQTVTVERAKYPVVTLRPDRQLNREEALSSIETNLASIGIIFTKLTEGIRVHPDTNRMPRNVRRTLYPPPLDATSKTQGQLLEEDIAQQHLEIIRRSLPPVPKRQKKTGDTHEGLRD